MAQALEGLEFLAEPSRLSQDQLQLDVSMWAVAFDLHARMGPGKTLAKA